MIGVSPPEGAQRWEVEVVGVLMREEHRVRPLDHGNGAGAPDEPAEDGAAEERVGQKPDAGNLDEDGGVPEVGDPRAHAGELIAMRRRWAA